MCVFVHDNAVSTEARERDFDPLKLEFTGDRDLGPSGLAVPPLPTEPSHHVNICVNGLNPTLSPDLCRHPAHRRAKHACTI